jgi:competence protein ComEC
MRSPIKQWTAAQTSAAVLYGTAAPFVAGALWYSFFDIGPALPAALLAVALALLLFAATKTIDRRALIAVLMIAAFSLGCVRMLLAHSPSAPLQSVIGENRELGAIVVEDPQKRHSGIHAVVERLDEEGERLPGRILLLLSRGEAVSYGDTLSVRGSVEAPEAFETETGATFDYPGYLAAKGIGAVMRRPSVEVIARKPTFFGGLYGLKHAIEQAIARVFPEPSGGLLKGMLLGERDALPEALTESFRRSSLVHIIVLSGYNLTIVALVLMWLMARVPWLSERAALALGALSIILFAAMVGFGATVVRATVMALIALLAQALKRPKAAMRALVFAAAAMVLHNPLVLAHDPSFVLSFLATFGLITLSPVFLSKLSFVPERLGLREIASATCATQAFILPALIFYTGSLSVVSLPANLLALPLVPLAMLIGAAAAGAGLLSSTLAFPLMLPAYGLLSIIAGIATLASSIPGAALDVSMLQSPLVFAAYALLAPLSLYAMNWSEEGETRTARMRAVQEASAEPA